MSPHASRRESIMRGRQRATLWLIGMVAAGGIGFGAGALQREAHAQSNATSTIYVPAGGLVFRAADGTPIARLSRGPHGGSFELFDDRGELHAAPTREVGPKAYVVDERDPWTAPATQTDRPGPGF
jgi:hypothetical protein